MKIRQNIDGWGGPHRACPGHLLQRPHLLERAADDSGAQTAWMITMDRTRELLGLWNWLPVFRAVAETEHIHEAAKRLHLSPSALSRTIRLLEDRVGQQLFERAGRRIQLNPAGQRFLQAVRDAMRRVDDGIAAARQVQVAGPVDIATPPELINPWLLPALDAAQREYKELVPRVRDLPAAEVIARMLRGEIDLSLTYRTRLHDQIIVERLCAIDHGVYCSPDHPLAHETRIAGGVLAEQSFVVAQPPEYDDPLDQWPVHLHRRVAMRVPSIELAAGVCAQGRHLTVLPDCIPIAARTQHRLHRLPFNGLARTEVFAVRRRPVSPDKDRISVVLDAIRARVESLEREMASAGCSTPPVH
jgi:DNA-binding transcriptional LysR family regulator